MASETIAIPWFVRINANWFSFLSASELSISINLFTGVTGGDVLPSRFGIVLGSTVLAFVAGALWGVVAWKLDAIQRSVIARRPSFVNEEEAWRAVQSNAMRTRFKWLLVGALMCTVASFGMLPISIERPKDNSASTSERAGEKKESTVANGAQAEKGRGKITAEQPQREPDKMPPLIFSIKPRSADVAIPDKETKNEASAKPIER